VGRALGESDPWGDGSESGHFKANIMCHRLRALASPKFRKNLPPRLPAW